MTTSPEHVHDTLRESLLVDGYDFVLDLDTSVGSELFDARNGQRYLDMFSFYGSNALGMNYPTLVEDARFRERLGVVALNKPTSSGVYTTDYADFVATFRRVVGDPRLPHLFFIEGGGLAVENALKVAFDWKSKMNEVRGRSPELGTQVLHLTRAFHGRTGYTMSLTNSAAIKVARFPKFPWPRIPVPAVTFPIDEEAIEAAETETLRLAREAFQANPHDIAAFIFEPIQAEGGDNHMRPQFLQKMQGLCREFDALLIADEVQTGFGLTGTTWAYQQFGVEPDIVAFGKKFQVCGIMAGGRVDEISDNAFAVSSRINSTWGGNLTDMVRTRRTLEIVEEEGIFARVGALGDRLLQELQRIAADYPAQATNPRGRGLMCAVDLPDAETRDRVLDLLFREEHVILLACGERSIRFRPTLTVSPEQLTEATDALSRVISRL